MELGDGTATQGTAFNNFLYTAENITQDAWSYNLPIGAGNAAFGINSTAIGNINPTSDGTSGLLLETGPVTDQTFASGSAIDATKQLLYVGGGDYSTLFDATAANTLTLTPLEDGSYQLEKAGFGKISFDKTTSEPGSAYYQALGYPNQTQTAIIAPNFVGLGLPKSLWLQTANLLYKVDLTFNADLTCDDSQGGICHLAKSCSNYESAWSNGWSFEF